MSSSRTGEGEDNGAATADRRTGAGPECCGAHRGWLLRHAPTGSTMISAHHAPFEERERVERLVLAELDSNQGFPLSTDQLAERLWAQYAVYPRVLADALWHLSNQGAIALARWPGPRPREYRPHWVITPSTWAQE